MGIDNEKQVCRVNLIFAFNLVKERELVYFKFKAGHLACMFGAKTNISWSP